MFFSYVESDSEIIVCHCCQVTLLLTHVGELHAQKVLAPGTKLDVNQGHLGTEILTQVQDGGTQRLLVRKGQPEERIASKEVFYMF